MKLNLGSGDDRREGFVSVDLRPEIADVVADVRALPFEPASVAEILALDVLEHLPPAHSLSTLVHWRDLLEPGGVLTLRVPNLERLCRMVVEDRATEAVIRNIYGGHKFGPDGELDHHCTGWTPKLLAALLGTAGFEVGSNDMALNMTVEALKPMSELADKIRTISVKKVSGPTDERERRLDADLDAYRRLRHQGLQPPANDGCARLEAEAVSKVEIEMGVVRTDLEPTKRKEWARAAEELMAP